MKYSQNRRGATRANTAEASADFRRKFAKTAEAYGNPKEDQEAKPCGNPAEALRKPTENLRKI